MTSPSSPVKLAPIVISGLVSALLCLSLALTPQQSFYPVARVVGESLSTTIVSRPWRAVSDCEIALQNVLINIQSACTNCNTSTSQCTPNLPPKLADLVSGNPIANFSATLPNGFVLYESADPSMARLACMQSQQLSGIKGYTVTCAPPDQPRNASTRSLDNSFSPTGWSAGGSWGGLWGSFGVALTALSIAIFVLQLGALLAPYFAYIAIGLPRFGKQLLILLTDIFVIEISLYLALVLRYEMVMVPLAKLWPLALVAPLIALPIFIRFGLYNAVMRYVGFQALTAIAKSVVLYALVLGVWVHYFDSQQLPHSLPAIQGLLTLLMIGATRALARKWLSQAHNTSDRAHPRKRTLIFGAGSAGVQLALALSHSREMVPVAFIDDDTKLHGKHIAGLKVHARKDLATVVHTQRVSEVLLAIPSTSRAVRNHIIAELETLPVQVRTLPGVAHLAEGKVKTSDLRDVDIEDLLGRDPVPPNLELLKANITGKAVMVTGAGGSIGSELCRQILSQHPRVLVLYELNEFALYTIDQDLRAQNTPFSKNIKPVLGSVTDPDKLQLVYKHFGIETVFHAAAYKHVPMVEKNPCAGAFNNILGTWQTARLAKENGVQTFVLISTDKAVRPTNTMGTTKRVAELILQALNQDTSSATRFVMVRFGNVLGSSGSVVPVFREQIRHGGPVTVTDPRIIRYFMTIPEAAQLVIQAGAMGHGGDVFVLDMGEPVKILDMARKMVNLSGLSVRDENNPSGDIDIAFTGLRPGEKLYEELLIGDNVTPTSHPRILRANEQMLSIAVVEQLVASIHSVCARNDSDALRLLLEETVREFVPQCGNEDLLVR